MSQQQKVRPNNNKNAKKSVGNSKKKKSVSDPPPPPTKQIIKSESNNNNSNKSVARKEKNKGKVDKLNVQEKVVVIPDPPVKLERAKTFMFGNKLNKVISKLTGSRESLNKIDETPPDNRFSLKRSLTLSSISIKRNNRKSMREPVLEELKEDTILEKVTNDSTTLLSAVTQRSASIFEPPPFKRSGSFIDRFRTKLSPGKTQSNLVRNSWSASLQNLQQIDTMVKYDDLKFVDYDKFNTYEQRIEQKLNTSLNASQTDLVSAVENTGHGMGKRYPSTSSLKSIDAINATIRMRSKKRISFNMNHMDEEKNLYRQSLDVGSLNGLMGKNKGKLREQNKRGSVGGFQDEEDYYNFLQESFKKVDKEENKDSKDSVDEVDSPRNEDDDKINENDEEIAQSIEQNMEIMDRPKSLPCISEVVEESQKVRNFAIFFLFYILSKSAEYSSKFFGL